MHISSKVQRKRPLWVSLASAIGVIALSVTTMPAMANAAAAQAQTQTQTQEANTAGAASVTPAPASAAAITAPKADANTIGTLASPDGSITASFALDAQGRLSYTVQKNDTTVIKPSTVGMVTSLGDFTSGLSYTGQKDPQSKQVKDSYDLPGSKVSHVDAVGNEVTLNLAKAGVGFDVVFRAYDDGVGMRYLINGQDGRQFTISSEDTEVALPDGAKSQAQYYNTSNEWSYDPYTNDQLPGQQFTMPYLYTTDDSTWVLLSEAGINGSYTGAQLYGKAAGTLSFQFAPEQTQGLDPSGQHDDSLNPLVVTQAPFASPWRFAVIGSVQTIAENTMAQTLSPASKVKDASWVESGTSDWSWLNGDLRHDQIPADEFETKGREIYEKYIDFAAEAGWKYQILDEGWQPRNAEASEKYSHLTDENGKEIPNYDPNDNAYYHGYYGWTRDVVKYARSKGVKLIAWVNSHDVQTPEQRKRLDFMASLGIAGFKIDFFQSARQNTLQLLDALYAQTAASHTVLDLHGITKPTGEQRTWPQVLTREAISAAEGYAVDDARDPNDYGGGDAPWGVNMTAANDLWMPFTRNAIGPADYDPMASYGANNNVRFGPLGKDGKPQTFDNPPQFTLAHMWAMPIAIQSGVQVMADKPDVYRNSVAYEHLWKNLPSNWDDTKLLDGYPGQYASIARRHGDDWYVAMLSAYKSTQTKKLSFDFLPAGKTYKAYIYKDDALRPTEKVVEDVRTVTKGDAIDLDLVSYKVPRVKYQFENSVGYSRDDIVASGGAVIHLEPVESKPSAADKTNLQAAIAGAKARLADAGAYTDDSVRQLRNALTGAEGVAADANASQQAVDDATRTLNDAIQGLRAKDAAGAGTGTVNGQQPGQNTGQNPNSGQPSQPGKNAAQGQNNGSAGHGQLSRTGVSVWQVALAAGLLLAVGAGVTLGRSRFRR